MDLKSIADMLAADGYKIKCKYADSDVDMGWGQYATTITKGQLISIRASKDDASIRIKIIHDPQASGQKYLNLQYEVYQLTADGGYTKIYPKGWGVVTRLEDAIKEAGKAARVESAELLTPHKFNDSIKIAIARRKRECPDGSKIIPMSEYEVTIAHAGVLGVVTIGDDRYLSIDSSKPGEDVWFLLDCYGTSGQMYLISDGNSWYLVKKSGGRWRVSNGTQGRSSEYCLDFVDQTIIRHAIKQYVGRL